MQRSKEAETEGQGETIESRGAPLYASTNSLRHMKTSLDSGALPPAPPSLNQPISSAYALSNFCSMSCRRCTSISAVTCHGTRTHDAA